MTRTSTVVVPGGAVAVNDVDDATTTLVAAAVPNFTVVPEPNPVPVTVTLVPPDDGPDIGDTPFTAGAPGGGGGTEPHVITAGDDIACGLVPPPLHTQAAYR